MPTQSNSLPIQLADLNYREAGPDCKVTKVTCRNWAEKQGLAIFGLTDTYNPVSPYFFSLGDPEGLLQPFGQL